MQYDFKLELEKRNVCNHWYNLQYFHTSQVVFDFESEELFSLSVLGTNNQIKWRNSLANMNWIKNQTALLFGIVEYADCIFTLLNGFKYCNLTLVILFKKQYLKPFNWIQIELFVFDSNTWNHLTVCNRITNVKLQYLKSFNWIQIELFVLDSNTWNHLTVSKEMVNIKQNYEW